MNQIYVSLLVILCTLIHKSYQQSCSYAQFIEFNGNDIADGSFIVSTPLECCNRCLLASRCSAWSWYATNGQCKLKTTMGSDLKSNNNCKIFWIIFLKIFENNYTVN